MGFDGAAPLRLHAIANKPVRPTANFRQMKRQFIPSSKKMKLQDVSRPIRHTDRGRRCREERRFRQLTEGQLVVMGRRTYESIGRPLPNRDVLVIGSQASRVAHGVFTRATFESAAEIIADDARPEAFIAGGEQIYRLFSLR